MADSKISALPSGAPAQAGDEYVIARSGANYKLTGSDVAAGAVANFSNGLFFRNRIINGDMRIDQRNAGASVTLSSNAYPVDRWVSFEDTDGAMTAQQSTVAPAGFTNSVVLTTTTADATLAAGQYARFFQSIEGLNVADLGFGTANARTITLSFWVRSSLTGTFGGSVYNSAFNRSYPFTYVINVADTWEYKSVTIPGDTTGTWLTNNGIGLGINFGLGTGSTFSGTAGAWTGSGLLSATGAVSVIGTLNATWYITGVQLETGSVATPFERRPFTTELQLCQRYFRKIGGQDGAQFTDNGATYADANTLYFNWFYDLTDMRVSPTFSFTGTANTDYKVFDSNFSAQTGFTFTLVAWTNSTGVQIQCAKTLHGLTNTPQLYVGSATSSGYLNFSSEL